MINQGPANWYAVQTRARNEKVILNRFEEQGLTTFLPLVTEIRRWSDRKKKVELPLFSCYVFVKMVIEQSTGTNAGVSHQWRVWYRQHARRGDPDS